MEISLFSHLSKNSHISVPFLTSKEIAQSQLLCVVECSDAHPCEGLSKHAHFRNFGIAFLTLFRVATGDNWNGIMKVSFSLLSSFISFFLLVALCQVVGSFIIIYY